MEKLEAVIFDYDGTIVDTERTYYEVMDFLVKKYTGKKMEKIDYIKNVSGTSVEQCKIYVTSTYGISEEDYNKMEEEMRDDLGYKFDESPLLPGIKEVIFYLKEKGIKVGVASNGTREHIEVGLKLNGLFEFVDDIVTKKDVEKPKPNPEIYLASAKRLGVNIQNCIAVEDSRPGALAASASGAYLVLQTNDITKYFDFSDIDYKEKNVDLLEVVKRKV